MAKQAVQSIGELLGMLKTPFTGERLFDYLREIVFFIKNAQGQYLVVNNTLVERCGASSKSQLIGRTSAEVLQSPFGDSFVAQDRKIVRTGQPLLGQLEMHVYPLREIGWCLTNKLPLKSRDGNVIGLVGVSQDLRLPNMDTVEYEHIAEAISHAEANIEVPPTVKELAELAEMSRYQLDNRMRRVFGLTTGQWLLKQRIDTARHQLQETNLPIANIALNVGYADQSAFSRQFRHAIGLTPRDYREASNP
jgi:AraC-like DNA-binding protein